MTVRRITGLVSAVMLATLGTAACGGTTTSDKSAGSEIDNCSSVDLSKPPAKPVPLRLAGATGSEVYAPWFMMTVSPADVRPNAGKWYDLENVPFADPTQRIPAFQSGQVDGFMSSAPPMFTLRARGVNVKAVAALGKSTMDSPTDVLWVVGPDSGIESFGDLAGKKVGLAGLGTGSELLFRMAVQAEGGDPTSLNPVNIPLPEQIPAVAAGSADSGLGVPPFVGPAVDSGAVRSLDSYHYGLEKLTGLKETEPTVLMMGDTFLSEHPDVMCAYLADYRTSLKWLNENTDTARKIFSDKGLVALPYNQYKKTPVGGAFPTGDALPDVKYYKAILPYAEKYGMVPEGSVDDVNELVWAPALEAPHAGQ